MVEVVFNGNCKMKTLWGSIFLVDGTWYLRYATGGGVLIPIKAATATIDCFEDGKMVELVGEILEDNNGCPAADNVTSVKMIGR